MTAVSEVDDRGEIGSSGNSGSGVVGGSGSGSWVCSSQNGSALIPRAIKTL